MEPGTKLKEGVLYYTKDGRGNVVPFNNGRAYPNGWDKPAIPAIAPVMKTHTKDVWCTGDDGMFSRHITDIAETEEEAKNIKYGSYYVKK